MFTVIAAKMLNDAGHHVSPADGIPGPWNVEGIGRDLTTGQLCDVARQHGRPWQLIGPNIIRSDMS